MRTLVAQVLLAFVVIPSALADAPTKATPKTIAADADACKELAGKCAAGAKLKAKVGNVTVYRSDGDQVRLAMVIDNGKEKVMTAPLDQSGGGCGAGKCVDVSKVTPKLLEVKLGDVDAVALDVTTSFTKSYNEAPKKSVKWDVRTFIVCGKGKSWSCVTATYGGQDVSCTASINKDGSVKHTCTETEILSF